MTGGPTMVDPTSDEPAGSRICALVLAAGRGQRFDPSGRSWKLAARLPDGRPVLRAACEAVVGVADEVAVVCGERHDEVARLLEGLPLRLLRCPDSGLGMGASLRFGIGVTRPAVGWLIALGDMPFVAPATHAAIRERLLAGALIARPVFEGPSGHPLAGRAGHPVGFAACLRARLLGIGDRTGAASLLRELPEAVQSVPCRDPGCVADVDVPADLDAGGRNRGEP